MQAQIDRKSVRRRIRYRVRRRLRGSAGRPRVAVFRSSKHLYAQAIDDDQGRTLAAVSTRDPALRGQLKGGGTVAAAKLVGGTLGTKLKEAGVETVVFDRGGFVYHGRVRAVAEALREAGLKL
jgi:large subunit ribosomal protein L18